MPSPLTVARRLARKVGLDVWRYPEADPLWRAVRLLAAHEIDVVVDVGANDGEYATVIRQLGYGGRIISFEPVQDPFQRLSARAASDRAWDPVRSALGDEDREVTINVSGNAATSSSVLPMLDSHLAVAPTSAYVGTEQVPQKRLDDVLPLMGVTAGHRVFLKVDAQGYEGPVLDGASRMLESAQLVGLQVELSLTPLYEGALTWQETMARATGIGMELMDVMPGVAKPQGRLLQMDAVFFRPGLT